MKTSRNPMRLSGLGVLNCADQREEVVQHMSEYSKGTLEVVGRQ